MLLSKCYQIRIDWSENGFTKEDSQKVNEVLQKSAGRCHVQILRTQMEGKGIRGAASKNGPVVSGFATLPLELQLSGRFSRLARWLSDIESQHGFQIDSWRLENSPSDALPTLSVKLTAFLGDA